MSSGRQCCLAALVTLTIFLTIAFSFLLGGVLNRIRGGYLDIGRHLPDYNSTAGYWQAHVISRLLFAAPIGIFTGLLGWHLKGGLVTGIMTWFSLYIGWGCYMSIGGDPNGFESRSGIFDWIIGRQLENWPYSRSVFRDYTGMSLRGLAWTAPAGYALYYMGFGWQYSLSGSLMALLYFAGFHTNVKPTDLHEFGKGIHASEFYWGAFIWLVLMFSSIARLTEHILKKWEKQSKNSDADFPRPSYKRSKWTKGKFGRTASAVMFELTMAILNVLFAGSVVFYALVNQEDVRSKGQTVFGIFTASVFLLMGQAFIAGKAWTLAYLKKHSVPRKRKSSISSREVRGVKPGGESPPLPRGRSDLANLVSDPFMSPFNRTIVPVDPEEVLPTYQEAEGSDGGQPRIITINDDDDFSGLREYAMEGEAGRPKSFLWDFTDILHSATGWIRNGIGILGLASTAVTLLFCLFTAAWNAHTARFIDSRNVSAIGNETLLYEIFSG